MVLVAGPKNHEEFYKICGAPNHPRANANVCDFIV